MLKFNRGRSFKIQARTTLIILSSRLMKSRVRSIVQVRRTISGARTGEKETR